MSKTSNNRRRRGGGGAQAKRETPRDLWRPVPAQDEPEPIRGVSDPSALIDSLGTPPLRSHSSYAEHYLAAVVERAATLASALAATADMVDDTDDG